MIKAEVQHPVLRNGQPDASEKPKTGHERLMIPIW